MINLLLNYLNKSHRAGSVTLLLIKAAQFWFMYVLSGRNKMANVISASTASCWILPQFFAFSSFLLWKMLRYFPLLKCAKGFTDFLFEHQSFIRTLVWVEKRKELFSSILISLIAFLFALYRLTSIYTYVVRYLYTAKIPSVNITVIVPNIPSFVVVKQ